MPQIAHFQVGKLKSSLPWQGGHPPPTPSPRSVATLPRAWSLRSLAKIVPPKCFGSLRHCEWVLVYFIVSGFLGLAGFRKVKGKIFVWSNFQHNFFLISRSNNWRHLKLLPVSIASPYLYIETCWQPHGQWPRWRQGLYTCGTLTYVNTRCSRRDIIVDIRNSRVYKGEAPSPWTTWARIKTA